MGINHSYAVLGLGRYGMAVAKELVAQGADIIAVDMDDEIVNMASAEIPYCKCADVTEIEALKQWGIANVDVVIVAMASHLEASVLATMLCKELGVETVIAKVSNDTDCKILCKVGADRVVFPERESGMRLAKNLLSRGFVDIIELSKDVSMLDLDVKEAWIGKSLKELNLRKKHSINVVAMIRNGEVTTNIDPDMPFEKDMHLIVVANPSKLSKLK